LGPEAVIIVDGGFESGSDMLKALALGADLVGFGKMQAMALAAGGSEGVARWLAILRAEFEIAMALAGARDLPEAAQITTFCKRTRRYRSAAGAGAGADPAPD